MVLPGLKLHPVMIRADHEWTVFVHEYVLPERLHFAVKIPCDIQDMLGLQGIQLFLVKEHIQTLSATVLMLVALKLVL